jgi:hypothetical protein
MSQITVIRNKNGELQGTLNLIQNFSSFQFLSQAPLLVS